MLSVATNLILRLIRYMFYGRDSKAILPRSDTKHVKNLKGFCCPRRCVPKIDNSYCILICL